MTLTSSKRQKLVKALTTISNIIEKCGGPGSGIPGPCPTGTAKPSGGGSGDRQPAGKVKVKDVDEGKKILTSQGFKQNGKPGHRAHQSVYDFKHKKTGQYAIISDHWSMGTEIVYSD